jgi:hypothetical protein
MAASKLDDPTWRKERARKAGQAAQSLDAQVERIVKNWPKLSDAQVAKLRALFTPVGGDAQ